MDGGPDRLRGVRAFYPTGGEVEVGDVPEGTKRVVARRATGQVWQVGLPSEDATRALPPGTYAIEALDESGRQLAAELTTVGRHPGERPVHGFAASYLPSQLPEVVEWLTALRCTVVQFYDWMETYSAPLGPPCGWRDPSGREISFDGLRALCAATRANGAVAHAYAPVYAVDRGYAEANPDLLMYRSDGAPERLFDNIVLADPSNARWQDHFVSTYGAAADALGFSGFHVDSYGFPRAGTDVVGRQVDMRVAYGAFLEVLRARRPDDQISFNQVNGVPSALRLPGGSCFRYCEIWPPNDRWQHFEGLLDRSRGGAGALGPGGAGCADQSPLRGTVACYPPVWVRGDDLGRAAALRTVVLTEAIATCLGAAALMYGDAFGVLCDPYYPKHERLSLEERAAVLAWHDFALRCRDLFLEGEDTSWYEIGDENGAVAVEWQGVVRPEPVGGALFARVVRADTYSAVGLVDLTGSPNGSWSEPTSAGSCRSARVRCLLSAPGEWRAAVATLGRADGRFVPVSAVVVPHREGLALQVEVPVDAGWSVLRFTRNSGPSATVTGGQ